MFFFLYIIIFKIYDVGCNSEITIIIKKTDNNRNNLVENYIKMYNITEKIKFTWNLCEKSLINYYKFNK